MKCGDSFCFFFSSRRRHTRYWRDWSSDVCSSDLPELAVRRDVLGVALDRHDVDRLGLVRVDGDREAEVGGEVPADLVPLLARVVRAHDVPVLLHEERVGPGRVHRDAVDAVADLLVLVRELAGAEALVDRLPRLTAVIGAEGAGRRYGDVHPVGVLGIDDDRVQAEAASAGLPRLAARVRPQRGQLLPVVAAVRGLEERRILGAGEDRVGVVVRRLEVPHARELPRVLRAVVPLVGAGRALVGELVADRLPRLAAVVGALHDLAEPAARLRRVEPVGIGRRPVEVVHLPAREVRALDVPLVAGAVGREDESALPCSYQQPNSAHAVPPCRLARDILYDERPSPISTARAAKNHRSGRGYDSHGVKRGYTARTSSTYAAR